MAYTETPFDKYTTYGLDTAQGLLNKNIAGGTQYPEYVSSATKAPTQEQYYNYTPTTPLAQVQAPDYKMSAGNYQGLMGGDYNAFQQALQQPGQISAGQAYNQGYQNLRATMGGAQGLYGSSMMGQQATQGLDRVYQEALAKNAAQAAATRYALESQEKQFGYQSALSREQDLNKYGMQVAQEQRLGNQAAYEAAANEANRKMQYEQGQMSWNQQFSDQMRNWQNQQQYERYTYDLARQQAERSQQEQFMNQALALAGQGAPLVNQAQAAMTAEANRQQQAQLAQQQMDVASQNAWIGAGGTVLGGLLGSNASGQNNAMALLRGLGVVK